MRQLAAAALLSAWTLCEATKVAVTVVEQRSGAPVTNFEAKDFAVFDDRTPRTVEDVTFTSETLDLMLLLDTSLAGRRCSPWPRTLSRYLRPKSRWR